MRRVVALLLVAGLGFAVASLIVSRHLNSKFAKQLLAREAVWQAEKADLESALDQARQNGRVTAKPIAEVAPAVTSMPQKLSPKDIIAKLQTLRVSPGGTPARTLREAVYLLEELAQAGPTALPAIREFLARYEDLDLDPGQFPGKSGKMPLEFTIPPTLRFGLFELVRRVAGQEAETILGESLARTGRGAEVAYLAAALQETAPGKYRDQAVGVARTLLASATPENPTSPIDRNHRDYLFGVLAMFGDTSFVAEAQTQLVRADNQIDRGALKYLQQTLGPQAVPIVAQAYQNPALTNSAAKEPLARLALNYVGADSVANEFYQKTINDPALSPSHRKNLIEDLNQDGFPNTKKLSASDLQLIQSRISLIEQLAPNPLDGANAAAFQEAYKDLLNMRTKIIGQPVQKQ